MENYVSKVTGDDFNKSNTSNFNETKYVKKEYLHDRYGDQNPDNFDTFYISNQDPKEKSAAEE